MNHLARFLLTLSYVTCIPFQQDWQVKEMVEVDEALQGKQTMQDKEALQETPGSYADEESVLHGLAKYLPAAGLTIGFLISLLLVLLTKLGVESLLASCIVVLCWLWLTGGLHMDGLMDTTDGVFSHRSRERMLEIMQDSRVGNFAVLIAISSLSIKVFALHALLKLSESVKEFDTYTLLSMPAIAVILIVPAWARFCEVYAIGRFKYARAQGKGQIWHDSIKYPSDLFVALIPVAIITTAAVFIWGNVALIAAGTTLSGGILTAFWLNAKLGGQTGDTYGAVVEAAETIGLLFSALSF
jgi:cobalamin 5'-phosphate synthase/cobalamin synthase